jgi:aspartate/methionine/tyrosine aminotransferase
LAIELNETLRENAQDLYTALSALGKELYFPRGILSQTAEAKQDANRYNCTIGIATERGKPMHLPGLMRFLPGMDPAEVFPYAPATGLPELRESWRKHQRKVNPGMEGKSCSLPLVTSGLTHGLSICSDLFCDSGDTLLLPDMIWGNYRMIFETRRAADIRQYGLFTREGKLDTGAFRDALLSFADRPKILVILNYPNNPTGYTPSLNEARDIHDALLEAAEAGANIVAIIDDAYSGLIYEDGIFAESLFSLICDAHPRLTAIKLDGATKEAYAWGFRLGFITFSVAGEGDREGVYRALEKKVGGLIRGTISNCSMPAQSMLIRAMNDPEYDMQKEANYRLLRERFLEVKEVVFEDRYSSAFHPYPFNSGYFMCVKTNGVEAEKLRLRLLEGYGVGVISLSHEDLRITFSCLEKGQARDLFDILYTAVKELG